MPNPDVYDGSDNDKLRDAYSLLEAATKYEAVRAVEFAKQVITTVALVVCPLRLYFIASQYNWGDLMKQAACRAVYEMSSAAYRRLLVYRQKCRDLILAHYTKSTPGAPPGTVDVAAPTRAMYWSKKGWLSEPNHYDLWMAMHIQMNENVSTGRSKPRQADAIVPALLELAA
ncbi:uncharacterized protein B0H18DRAFT_1020600 [Fomitopsis serialis]|uniref:uncharacterized protein n=1 Tax=Fomitopsis serialis TaxID=139415 RepID=UPI0020078864|nr:uncharacterized protein B0H18DRAFT_1020600 [Neoantrodia serialis]KAH9921636.1 hypothetical protein B0H18DRAFT_1020600 [Neoantrodia serialis]